MIECHENHEKTAKNVDAAKAFVNWLLSDAGQQYMVVQGYIPGKDGVAGPSGRRGEFIRMTPSSSLKSRA